MVRYLGLNTIQKAVLIVLSIYTAFTQACVWSKRTLVVVSSCPATEEATQKAARIKKCEGLSWTQNCTTPSKFKYHCLYSYPLRKLVEVCAAETSVHGGCLMYDLAEHKIQHLYNVECGDSSTTCADTYMSTDAHLLAPCPNLRNLTFPKTPPTVNTPQDTKNWLWSIPGICVIVIIILITYCIIRRKRRKKRKRNENQLLENIKKKKRPYRNKYIDKCDEELETQLLQNTQQNERNKYIVKADMKYEMWKTNISDEFSRLSGDDVSVLFCFLCSDFGTPDFTDTDWLDILNVIRKKIYFKDSVTSEEAQRILGRLKSSKFLWDKDIVHITENVEDETMYHTTRASNPRIAENAMIAINQYDVHCLLNFTTTVRYLRSRGYTRKPGEKCIISDHRFCDTLLISRLQMDILTHVTMEDTEIYDEVSRTLNIPKDKLKDTRIKEDFLKKLKQNVDCLLFRERSQGRVQHIEWLWRYRKHARPDIVRSCLGRHPHLDIYIINNTAYRKHSPYHGLPPAERCLLYCLLMVDDYTVKLKVKDESHIKVYNAVRERYFPVCEEITAPQNPERIVHIANDMVMFKSNDIRHDVMYAFVTDCLVEDSDLEFFLTTASRDVISEYCRSWEYMKSEGERCLYIPDKPDEMYDLFIDRLQLDILTHCTMSDEGIHGSISKRLGVPLEILRWELEARERYVEYAKRGTRTVHHARGMIVGCAGAGKTTLLKRLLRCSDADIRDVKSTEGLEVHDDIFQICEKSEMLIQAKKEDWKIDTAGQKTLTMFDFGGQSAYYACHQIYLTGRGFYIVVVDASKRLDRLVNKEVCDQAGSVFSKWTYQDYFVFWIKSIHTYCGTERGSEPDPEVIIVATHWDENIYKGKKENLINSLQHQFPKNSSIGAKYIRNDNCFFTEIPQRGQLERLSDLEKHIFDIVCHKRWAENIPNEWAFMEIELPKIKSTQRVQNINDIAAKLPGHSTDVPMVYDMLRYYHDAGKVLYFKENNLKDTIILDIQWFVDAFKNVITDKLHLKGIEGSLEDWEEYYQTGHLKDCLLTEIWRKKDFDLHKELLAKDKAATGDDISKDPRYLLPHKDEILMFMNRLGLVAVGEESHYVPCMNREDLDGEIANLLFGTEKKSSVLLFRFDFLPYFLFFRLVVSCMHAKNWEVLQSNGKLLLYRNMALFVFSGHHVVIAATETTIQLQVYQLEREDDLEVEKSRNIQEMIEKKLNEITPTFHRKMRIVKGFICKNGTNLKKTMKYTGQLISVGIKRGDKVLCPLHQGVDRHFINTNEITKFWITENKQ